MLPGGRGSRKPATTEIERLVALHDQSLERYQKDAAAAGKLAKGPLPLPAGVDPAELAAWTVVGNVLLNLDETLSKE